MPEDISSTSIMVNLNIKATNFELDEKTRDFVETKIGKIIEKFSGKQKIEWKVLIEIERSKKQNKGEVFKGEILMIFPGAGKGIKAEGNGSTWRQALDEADERMRRKLRDFKGKKMRK